MSFVASVVKGAILPSLDIGKAKFFRKRLKTTIFLHLSWLCIFCSLITFVNHQLNIFQMPNEISAFWSSIVLKHDNGIILRGLVYTYMGFVACSYIAAISVRGKKPSAVNNAQEIITPMMIDDHLESSIADARSCSHGMGIPLCVPFYEKEQVKRVGAKWCPQQKTWYWMNFSNVDPVLRWVPDIYNPSKEPPYILPNLVPQQLWGINLRKILPKSKWDELRKKIYASKGYCCEVCGGKGHDWPVECEESWKYFHVSEISGVASLTRLQSLCPTCHKIKHLGKANIDGTLDDVAAHMAALNLWSKWQTNTVVQEAFALWEERSQMNWSFNFDSLKIHHDIEVVMDTQTIQPTEEFQELV